MSQIPIADGVASAAGWCQSLLAVYAPRSGVSIFGTRIALLVPLIGWFYIVRRYRSPWLLLAPLIALSALSLVRVAATTGASADEVEHLHVSWLITQDVLPYRDAHQNHAPLVWLLATALLSELPESAYVVYAFRGMTLLALGVSIALACMLLRSVADAPVARLYPVCVFLALTQAVEAQMYRFRPDSFMIACALGSLVCLMRRPRRQWLYSLLAGSLIGLAISFSPKVGLQLGVAGLAVLISLLRRQHLDSLRLSVGYGVGLLLGLLPVFVWLASRDLSYDAWHSIFPGNTEILTSRRSAASWVTSGRFLPRVLNMAPYLALILVGAIGFLRPLLSHAKAARNQLLPGILIVAAVGLYFAFATFAPNYLAYHIAGGLVLGAVLAAGVVDRLMTWGDRGLRSAVVAVVLVLCMGDTWIRSGIAGRVEGTLADVADIQKLLEITKRRGGTCVCLAPLHPIFALDVGDTYTAFDQESRHWDITVEQIMRRSPGVVMDLNWTEFVRNDRLTTAQVNELTHFLSKHYDKRRIGNERYWLLRRRTEDLSIDH